MILFSPYWQQFLQYFLTFEHMCYICSCLSGWSTSVSNLFTVLCMIPYITNDSIRIITDSFNLVCDI